MHAGMTYQDIRTDSVAAAVCVLYFAPIKGEAGSLLWLGRKS